MKTAAVVLLVLLLVAGVVALSGWLWMLCLGGLSHIFHVNNLAISFWQSVLVSLIFGVLFGGLRGNSKDK